MNRYLLLRDNKQTGPFTVPELVEKGIKPYDLVWLDGRSAAWRYPSEIEELKAYAPVVEEQPYDRFYKKPSAETKEPRQTTSRTQHAVDTTHSVRTESPHPGWAYTQTQTSSPAVHDSPVGDFVSRESAIPRTIPQPVEQIDRESIALVSANSKPGLSEQGRSAAPDRDIAAPDSNIAPRKIYVTLPGSGKPQHSITPAPTAAVHRIPEADSPYMPRPSAAEMSATSPLSPDNRGTTGVGNSGEYPLGGDRSFMGNSTPNSSSKYLSVETRENSFSAKLSVDDPYTDKPYTDKVPPTSKIPVIPIGRFNWALTAIGAVCLLLGGVIIGLVISNRNQAANASLDQLVSQIRERENAKSAVLAPKTILNDEATTDASDIQANLSASAPVENVTQPVGIKEPRNGKQVPNVVNNKPSQATDNKQADEAIAAVVIEEKPLTVQPTVIREERNVNHVNAEAARKNIRQLVSVVNNKYKTGVLGGISDLNLTVSNKSEFELDQVEVEVEYLGPEKRVVKKQLIVFTNVKPGKTLTQEVPRTNRGVTVNTTIRSINSKSLGLASSGL